MSTENRLSINLRNLFTWVRSRQMAAASDAEVRTYVAHLACADVVTGEHHYGTAHLSRLAGICPRAVKAANKSLAERGLIRRDPTPGGTAVATTTVLPVNPDSPVNPGAPVHGDARTGEPRCTGTGERGCTRPVNPGAPKRTSRRDKVKGPEKGPVVPESLSLSSAFTSAWQAWQAHRRDKKQTLTPRAAELQLKDCAEWGPDRAVAAIEHSIKQGYTGLYEPKGGNGTNGKHVRTAAERGEFAETIDLSRVTLNPGAS